MRTVLLTSVSAIALATSAAAADLAVAPVPYKAPPPVLATWTGFYLGLEGGFAQHYANWNDIDGFFSLATRNIGKTGGIFGGYAGYNWQNGSLVLGVETDVHWVGAKATQSYFTGLGPFITTATQTDEVRWLGSTRLRAGLDFQSTLFYLTGGVAYGNVRDNVTVLNGAGGIFGPPAGSVRTSWNQDQTRVGWTAGFGVEHMFGNWVGRADVRYTDLGHSTVNCVPGVPVGACTAGGGGNYRADFAHTLWTGMVGLAYKF
jgi:outer membrane immunogenic protein